MKKNRLNKFTIVLCILDIIRVITSFVLIVIGTKTSNIYASMFGVYVLLDTIGDFKNEMEDICKDMKGIRK